MQEEKQEINIDNIQREFAEICRSVQKLMNSINQMSNNLAESMKKVGAVTAHVEDLGPRIDAMNTFAQSGHQERMVLKSRITQLEGIVEGLNKAALEKLDTDDEDKIVSVIEDEI